MSAVLETRDAYRLWSETYDAENPLTALDKIAVSLLTPSLTGLDLLDAACGTGRRLVFPSHRPRSVAGIDLVFEMLAMGRKDPVRPRATAEGDLRAIAEKLSEVPEVACVVITSGGFDLLAEVVCEDDDHLLEILGRVRAVPCVTSTETFVYLKLRKQTYSWGTR